MFYYLWSACFAVIIGAAVLIYLHGLVHEGSPQPASRPSLARSPGREERSAATVLPPPVLSRQMRARSISSRDSRASGNATGPGGPVSVARHSENDQAAAGALHEVKGGASSGSGAASRNASVALKAGEGLTIRNETLSSLGARGVFSATEKKLLQQAEELRSAGKIQAAMAIYRRLWNGKPTAEVGNNLAACYIISGRYHEARQVLERALKLSPGDPDLLYNLGLLSGHLRSPQPGSTKN